LTNSNDLIVDVVAIQRHTGNRRDVVASVDVGTASVGDTDVVDSSADVELVVEAVIGGLRVTGTVRSRWSGPCRRCLDDLEGDLEVEISEMFQLDPTEGEAWPITDERIDLTPAVREAVILALPLAPLCEESCRGPEPDRFPTGLPDDEHPSSDPRWAVLDGLSFDESKSPD